MKKRNNTKKHHRESAGGNILRTNVYSTDSPYYLDNFPLNIEESKKKHFSSFYALVYAKYKYPNPNCVNWTNKKSTDISEPTTKDNLLHGMYNNLKTAEKRVEQNAKNLRFKDRRKKAGYMEKEEEANTYSKIDKVINSISNLCNVLPSWLQTEEPNRFICGFGSGLLTCNGKPTFYEAS